MHSFFSILFDLTNYKAVWVFCKIAGLTKLPYRITFFTAIFLDPKPPIYSILRAALLL